MMAERLAEIRRDLDSEAYTSYLPKTVRELLDHIAQLEAQRGGAVVVPEMPEIERAAILSMARDAYTRNGDTELVCEQVIGDTLGWVKARAKAIPASRVLADGMVGVDRERLAALEAISDKIEALALGPDGRAWTPLHYREFARGELRRAQQAKGE